MNIEKLIQLVNYFLRKYDNRLNYTKLIKLLYLADRQSFIETNSSISEDKYYSMPNGPVLSQLYNLIKGKAPAEEQILWNARFVKDGYDLAALSVNIPEGLLSEYDKEIIDKIDREFHDNSFSELIEYTHHCCPEWVNPQGSSITLSVRDILEKLGKPPEEIQFVLDENQIYEQEEKILSELETD